MALQKTQTLKLSPETLIPEPETLNPKALNRNLGLHEPSSGWAEVDRLAWLLNPQLDLSRSNAEFKGGFRVWGLGFRGLGFRVLGF